MYILGINAYHGDASACLLKDGEIIAACEEERLNRIKHCAGFPKLAILACLKQAGISLQEIEAISISRNPSANLHKKILYTLRKRPSFSGLLKSRLANVAKISNLESTFQKEFHLASPLRTKIYRVEHHLAHMASAFFTSPFEEAAIVSLDGFGDFVSAKWGYGEGNRIRPLGQIEFPHSLGLLYTAITQYLGFPKYGDEYKVMALASFGEPRYLKEFRTLIQSKNGKGFQLDLDFFLHHRDGVQMTWEKGAPVTSLCYSQRLNHLLGPPRSEHEAVTDRHHDIACSLQTRFEEIYFEILKKVYELTKKKNLCLAGGCAFNSVANGKILEKTPFRKLFIQPVAGDAGTSLGGACYTRQIILKKNVRFPMTHAYWGPDFTASEIESTLREAKLPFRKLLTEELIKVAARAIESGKIVGWFQGRMEFGPRALGNRSLLADPRHIEMKEKMNRRIKHREPFRPFAPSILEERGGEYFEGIDREPFMIRVFRVKEDKRKLIPAVTHVDGTGRLQTVDRHSNPRYWALLNEFEKLTGIPVLLNTSFNENEPIVCTPEDAVNCYQRTEIDVLAIGDYWVEKTTQKFS